MHNQNNNDWERTIKTVRQPKDIEEEKKVCSLCGKPYSGFGNNGKPLIDGRVCDECNRFVVLYRLKLVQDKKMPKMRSFQFAGEKDDTPSPQFFDSAWQLKLREKEE